MTEMPREALYTLDDSRVATHRGQLDTSGDAERFQRGAYSDDKTSRSWLVCSL